MGGGGSQSDGRDSLGQPGPRVGLLSALLTRAARLYAEAAGSYVVCAVGTLATGANVVPLGGRWGFWSGCREG